MALPNNPESWALLKRQMEQTDIIEPLPTSFTNKLINHALMYSTGIPTFKVKWETTKMNIQEKDCRRCEDYDGEKDWCISADFKPLVENGCAVLTPITGRDCRNCERFNGQGQDCVLIGTKRAANNLTNACSLFDSIQTSKSSPTVLVYTDREGDKIRVTKGDKTLSLNNIWSGRPCGDEYRAMSVVFTQAGFNPDAEINFQQDNLDRLSDLAFHWLLEEDFFIKAEEEEVGYKVGQWFTNNYSKYVLCRSASEVILICMGSNPAVCSPGRWASIKAANQAIGNTCWQELKPIDRPF